MKCLIRENFTPSTSFLVSANALGVCYFLGRAKKDIESKKAVPLFQAKSINKATSFFAFNSLPQKQHNTKNGLIYISATNTDALTQINKLKLKEYNFFHIEKNYGGQEIKIKTILENSQIKQLDLVAIFRLSHLSDWKIKILYSQGMNLECVVLNTFLSLGAQLDQPQISSKNFIQEKIYPISFQHSINVYRDKNS